MFNFDARSDDGTNIVHSRTYSTEEIECLKDT